MTPEAQLALIAAVPSYLTALSGVIMAFVAFRIQVSKADAEKQQREVSGKLEEIHTLTNSNWTAAMKQIAGLEASLASLKADKAVADERADVAASKLAGSIDLK